MLKQIISLFLCLLLAVPGFAQPVNKQQEQETKLKQKIVAWGTQKKVAVKLKSGEKFGGNITAIQDDLFALQVVAQDGKVTERKIPFSAVDKIASQDGSQAGRIAGNTALYVLAGLGIFALGVFIIQARN